MVINPDISVTPDCPTVKFREPKELVNLNIELPKVLVAQGWGLGTYFNVQFINHERTVLLWCGYFVVSGDAETLQTRETIPYQPVTSAVHNRTFKQIGDWLEINRIAKPADVNEGTGASPSGTQQAMTAKWNLGKRGYDILRGEEVVGFHVDKDTAEKMAAGELPLTEAA